MDAIKCRALLKACERGSLSAAAAELGYTPSGISRMVAALEAEVGFPLLARNRKGVVPTEAAQTLMPSFREMARWDEQIAELAADIRGVACGSITVGTYFSIAAVWMPAILDAFQREFPDIRIEVKEGDDLELDRMIIERSVDCCFMANRNLPGDWVPLAEDDMVVWLPASHPRAHGKSFPLKELDGIPFIMPFPDTDNDIERLLAADGLEPDVRFSSKDNLTVYAMVEAGLGASMNNELMTANLSGGVVVLPLDPPRTIELGIAVPSLAEASPATKRFVECALRTRAAR